MKFTHRITWNIGLNRGSAPYPAAEAIEAVRDQLARRGIDGFYRGARGRLLEGRAGSVPCCDGHA